jgi:hypothetical protein
MLNQCRNIVAKFSYSIFLTKKLFKMQNHNSTPVWFIPFNNDENKCVICGCIYSVTFVFKQKYCKYCLNKYIKTTDTYSNVQTIIRNNTQYTKREEIRNTYFYTNNIQDWYEYCSEILYFEQVFNRDEAYCSKLSWSGTVAGCKCNKCLGHYQISSCLVKSTLSEEFISILHLQWWDSYNYCRACLSKLNYTSDNQKWCSHCFIIYTGCRYCLTTNIIFGITDQSQCIKCKRISFINVDIMTNSVGAFLAFTKIHSINLNLISNNVEYYDAYKFNNIFKSWCRSFKSNNIFKPWYHSFKLAIKWVPYHHIKNFNKIAEGGFSTVYKATWKHRKNIENNYDIIGYLLNSSTVAVKKFF